MFFLTYIYCKVLAFVIRTIVRSQSSIAAKPDEVYQIKSRDAGRNIKAHIYRSKAPLKPAPVLINFHGSGFILPAHGADDEYCRLMSQRTEYTVLDVQYRLAPEHPFPAALNDVEDFVNWVLQQPQEFDRSRIALSGFSAGGNLALAASSNLFRRETFYAVLTFYPPVDLYTEPGSKTAPDPAGKPLPAPLARFFDKCYIPSSHNTKDPRISPYYAQPERFPDRILIITAAGDGLAPEAERLAAKLGNDSSRKVVSQRMDGCNHGWNISPKTPVEREARDRAYGMVVAMLNGQ
ncbi:Alpha/Beta hydrolase protein [Aspergillus pseudoustus]|uniref:Alpha/Beta hydrolase protein n=1 Tax=Aspergillus pseudoustus TaxID=1810923 RepID=A0ABR4KEN8_9EURO